LDGDKMRLEEMCGQVGTAFKDKGKAKKDESKQI